MNNKDLLYIVIVIVLAWLIVDNLIMYHFNGYSQLRKSLKNSGKMKGKWKNSGIVTTVTDSTVPNVIFTVNCLRFWGINNSQIFIGYSDLDYKNINIIKKLGVKCGCVSDKLNFPKSSVINDRLTAFSIIASPYKNVLFISPNTVFLQDPRNLLNGNNIFWKTKQKKSISDYKNRSFVTSLINYKRENNPILNGESGICQNPNVMCMYKTSTLMKKLFILAKEEPNPEIYWMACELNKDTYDLIDEVGTIDSELLFMDHGNPLFLTCNPDKLKDYNNFTFGKQENPFEYFQKTLTGEKINTIHNKNNLNNEEKEILNNFAEIWHDTI